MTEVSVASARFSGVPLRTRTIAGVRLTEKRHEAEERLAPHSHAAPYVTFVLEGGYDETRGGRSVICSDGCAVLHEAGETHEDRFGPRATRLLNVEWDGSSSEPPALPAVLALGPATRRIAATLLAELRRPDAASPLVVESLAAEVVMLGHRPESPAPAPSWLRQVEERLRDEYRDPPALEELAREAGVHRSHLARAFRALHGCTIGELVRELRLGWALERLRRGASIAAVATEAGFADQSHMTRWFVRTLGRTPGRSC
jgi:AraC family transcriptional regulator